MFDRTLPGMVLAAAVLAAVPAAAHAQTGTDIHLATMRVDGGNVTIGEPVNATRRAGYDNQPFFTPDGRFLLYTSLDSIGQADIYRVELPGNRSQRLTNTRESEYSPTPIEGGGFSVIRVEADSTQRLWRFDGDGTNPVLVLPDVKPVGYHAWGDANMLALFVLGSPATLRLADSRTGEARIIAEGIGRSLQKIPGRAEVSFVRRTGERSFRVEAVDVTTGATRVLVDAVPGGEFHAWTPEGILLMTSGTTLFQWSPAAPEWREVADFAADGLTLSRIAVSPRGDRIALVADEAAPAR